MNIKSLSEQLEEAKRINAVLIKRDRVLRERIAYMLWFQFTTEFNGNENQTIKELDRLDDIHKITSQIKDFDPIVKLTYLNRNWFVNKHIDKFLSQIS